MDPSMVSLVPAANAVAEPELAPIFRVPVPTLCTTKATTVPSLSASSPREASSAKVISASLSSSTVSTADENAASVGRSLMVMLKVSLSLSPAPSATVKLKLSVVVSVPPWV